jgi:hypothetical protein
MDRVERQKFRRLLLGPLVAMTVGGLALNASTASAQNMIAKFIRIDPEPTTDEKKGTPVIPMLVELGTPTPINSFAEGCFQGAGNKVTQDGLKCMSNKIQKERYIKQYEFPTENAVVFSIVGDESKPMKIIDAIPFKDATAVNAGVAWLILVDASSSVGSRWPEMQETAIAMINAMGPNDAVQVRVMDDKSVRASTKWLAASAKGQAVNTVKAVGATFKTGAPVDSLISRIEKETVGGFQSLFKDGVQGAEEGIIPLVQSVVILSDGGDTSAAGFAGGTKAQVIHEKLVKGDLGIMEGMRLPIPVVSIWFPANEWGGTLAATRRENEYQWMSNMATPEVGGYFDIYQDAEGAGKGARIAKTVRERFDSMYYVEVQASCLSTTGEQKFKLAFTETKSKIVPDTWSNVPIGFNFTKWLLDVDKKQTEETASKNPLRPGETFKVFGNFCWGSNTGAAEAYFLTEADAAAVKKAAADKTGEDAKKLLQSLSAKGQKATTISASHTDAEFRVPSTPVLFENKPENFSLNVVILDNKALRVSARDKSGLLVLRAGKAPINKMLIIGAVGGGIVLILLIAILARGGGNGRAKRRKGGAPPAPGPMPGQPPSPAPVTPAPVATPSAPSPVSPFGSPPFGAPPFGAPPQVQAPATAFAPPPQFATAFAPPQQPQFPPAAVATAYAPPQPVVPPQFAQASNFEAGVAHPTRTPAGAVPVQQARGLHEINKGATSFPTTCPNPSCRRPVLVPPGGTAQCAFCGTLVDASGAAAAPIQQQGFGLTGAASETAAAAAAAAIAAAQPPGGTVALQQGLADVRSIVLQGAAGTFRVLAGIESRVGRDGTMCSIALNEARVSGVHATLKLEGGILYVRDDKSHNGTFVNGNRIAPGTWIPVPGGSQLRFGPIEFVVRHES